MAYIKILEIVAIVVASNGLWGLIQYKISSKDNKKSAVEKGLLAVLHDRLYQACKYHIRKDYVTVEEFDNIKYMYEAYTNLGGNGTVKILYEKLCKLEMVATIISYSSDADKCGEVI